MPAKLHPNPAPSNATTNAAAGPPSMSALQTAMHLAGSVSTDALAGAASHVVGNASAGAGDHPQPTATRKVILPNASPSRDPGMAAMMLTPTKSPQTHHPYQYHGDNQVSHRQLQLHQSYGSQQTLCNAPHSDDRHAYDVDMSPTSPTSPGEMRQLHLITSSPVSLYLSPTPVRDYVGQDDLVSALTIPSPHSYPRYHAGSHYRHHRFQHPYHHHATTHSSHHSVVVRAPIAPRRLVLQEMPPEVLTCILLLLGTPSTLCLTSRIFYSLFMRDPVTIARWLTVHNHTLPPAPPQPVEDLRPLMPSHPLLACLKHPIRHKILRRFPAAARCLLLMAGRTSRYDLQRIHRRASAPDRALVVVAELVSERAYELFGASVANTVSVSQTNLPRPPLSLEHHPLHAIANPDLAQSPDIASAAEPQSWPTPPPAILSDPHLPVNTAIKPSTTAGSPTVDDRRALLDAAVGGDSATVAVLLDACALSLDPRVVSEAFSRAWDRGDPGSLCHPDGWLWPRCQSSRWLVLERLAREDEDAHAAAGGAVDALDEAMVGLGAFRTMGLILQQAVSAGEEGGDVDALSYPLSIGGSGRCGHLPLLSWRPRSFVARAMDALVASGSARSVALVLSFGPRVMPRHLTAALDRGSLPILHLLQAYVAGGGQQRTAGDSDDDLARWPEDKALSRYIRRAPTDAAAAACWRHALALGVPVTSRRWEAAVRLGPRTVCTFLESQAAGVIDPCRDEMVGFRLGGPEVVRVLSDAVDALFECGDAMAAAAGGDSGALRYCVDVGACLADALREGDRDRAGDLLDAGALVLDEALACSAVIADSPPGDWDEWPTAARCYRRILVQQRLRLPVPSRESVSNLPAGVVSEALLCSLHATRPLCDQRAALIYSRYQRRRHPNAAGIRINLVPVLEGDVSFRVVAMAMDSLRSLLAVCDDPAYPAHSTTAVTYDHTKSPISAMREPSRHTISPAAPAPDGVLKASNAVAAAGSTPVLTRRGSGSVASLLSLSDLALDNGNNGGAAGRALKREKSDGSFTGRSGKSSKDSLSKIWTDSDHLGAGSARAGGPSASRGSSWDDGVHSRAKSREGSVSTRGNATSAAEPLLRGGTSQHSPLAGRNATTATSAGPAVSPVSPISFSDEPKIIPLTPAELLNHLATNSPLAASSPYQASSPKSPSLPQNANLLLLDLRAIDDFTAGRIAGSVNLSLPQLILKRFRKGTASTFNLDPFLTNPESRLVYQRWCRSGPVEQVESRTGRVRNVKCVIVLDDDMKEGEGSDAWTLVKILREGVLDARDGDDAAAADPPIRIVKDDAERDACDTVVRVGFLVGGFAAFEDHPGSGAFAAGSGYGAGSPMSIDGEREQEGDGRDSVGATTLAPSRLVMDGGRSQQGKMLPVPSYVVERMQTPRRTNSASSSSPMDADSPYTATQVPQGRKRSTLSVNTNSPSSTTSLRGMVIDNRRGSNLSQHLTPEGLRGSPATTASSEEDVGCEAFTPEIMEPVSKITEYLMLGSDIIPTARDATAQLKRIGVTHVLNMAKEVQDASSVMDGREGVTGKWIGIQDSAEQDAGDAIKDSIDFIDNIILVHCRAGKSRSVTVVIAYLMMREDMTLRKAYELVRSVRHGAAPNIGFMMTLMRIEKEKFGFNTTISD
ncbi:hypothetical protein HK101_010037 [Irineochytrium annulatum]|nr:hypothetical protein HK101_010037 [Irineochytrium annulatum]